MTKTIPGVEDIKTDEYKKIKYGKEMRKQFFFRDNFRNLNHGSFGTHPRSVASYLHQLQELGEVNPDAFHRYTIPRLVDRARLALAPLFGAPARDIVLVPNVTTSVNVILRNIVFEPGDGILFFGDAYGAVQKCIYSVCETNPVVPVRVPLVHPISDDELLNSFEEAVQKFVSSGSGKRIRVALFDTITSMPGYRMPFERLTAACKRLGILSLIDGAHGAGHLPLNLSKLDPDFFTTNLHKWLFVPRGCAIFYVPLRNQHLIRTSFPTSHNFVPQPEFGPGPTSPLPAVEGTGLQGTPFSELFKFVGTLDVTAYLVVPESLRFREEVCGGEQTIMEYNWDLAEKAGALLSQRFGTEVLDNPEKTLNKESCMRNIRLPLDPDLVLKDVNKNDTVARGDAAKIVGSWIGLQLLEQYQTYVPVLWYAGKWWVRISAQIYLEEEDFEFLTDACDKICQRINKGELADLTKPGSEVGSLAKTLQSSTIEDA